LGASVTKGYRYYFVVDDVNRRFEREAHTRSCRMADRVYRRDVSYRLTWRLPAADAADGSNTPPVRPLTIPFARPHVCAIRPDELTRLRTTPTLAGVSTAGQIGVTTFGGQAGVAGLARLTTIGRYRFSG
jgi:hypothetical protein